MFKENLIDILNSLPINRNKNEIMIELVNDRLLKSDNTYRKELELILTTVTSKNELKVMRKISKYGL